MATIIRNEVSKRNKYYIPKHEYLMLKHFCLLYPERKKEYLELSRSGVANYILDGMPRGTDVSDRTAAVAIRMAQIKENLRIIEEAAEQADPYISKFILKAVTDGYSFTYLKTVMEIPCERDYYYERYRRFFYILSHKKQLL